MELGIAEIWLYSSISDLAVFYYSIREHKDAPPSDVRVP